MSRRLKTINNLKYGLLLKCVNIPLQMLIRWVIINYLGVEYLGLNALMLSVLNIIASLELGFGIALSQSLYEPISKGDSRVVGNILSTYRYIFRRLAIAILSVGLIFLFALEEYTYNFSGLGLDIRTVWILYLSSTLINFIFVPERIAFINAVQLRSVYFKYTLVFKGIIGLLQCGVLIYLSNFYLFVLLLSLFTTLRNLSILIFTKKHFPELSISSNADRIF